MAAEIIMPRVGQSVESCIIIEWKVKEGDVVVEGQPLCEVETDKATLDVESTAAGTVLGLFASADDDIPVLQVIAAVGEPGEDIEAMRPVVVEEEAPIKEAVVEKAQSNAVPELNSAPVAVANIATGESVGVSPRAKKLAISKGIDYTLFVGSGPDGRVIERDILAAIAGSAPLSAAAKARMDQGGLLAPLTGSGIGGRVVASDLIPQNALGGNGGTSDGEYVNLKVLASDLAALMPKPEVAPIAPVVAPVSSVPVKEDVKILDFQGEYKEIKVKGVKKMVADRMFASLQTTAQLTLNASADARAILAYRKECKAASESEGLAGITINDTVMYAIVKTVEEFPEFNAYMLENKIVQFENVHVGFAVDTPRGLMVPVIRNANKLSLKELSAEAKRLGKACLDGSIDPDYLGGGTFTVTNLGAMGIESFTPVLNAPQVGIMGVCSIQLKPVMDGGDVTFVPHLGLSLTFDHCAADGAPAARFIQVLSAKIADFKGE